MNMNLRFGRSRFARLRQFDAVHPRHHDAGEQHVHLLLPENLNRLVTRSGYQHAKVLRIQDRSGDVLDVFVFFEVVMRDFAGPVPMSI